MASNNTKATHPFYSPAIRSALQQLVKPGSKSNNFNLSSSFNVDTDTSDDESKTITSNDDESDESSDEDESSAANVDVDERMMISPEQLAVQLTKSSVKHTKKKKAARAIQFNNAPSITLPLPSSNTDEEDFNQRQPLAISIPTIHLPNNYLKNHVNVDSSEVASHLLAAWGALHPNNHDDGIQTSPTILIVLLQSGRFASAVFTLSQQTSHNNNNNNNVPTLIMLAHKTSTRYTIRKGQGGSQSAHDANKSKAKSMGAQLRREGEKQLRHDVITTWKEWKRCGYVKKSVGVWIGVPKAMRRDYLFGGDTGDGSNAALVDKKDERLKSIPLDYGRPTLEAVEAVMECLMRCEVGEFMIDRDDQDSKRKILEDGHASGLQADDPTTENGAKSNKKEDAFSTIKTSLEKSLADCARPYTPLHEAILAGDLEKVTKLMHILEQQQTEKEETEEESYDINTKAGPEYQTPLHLASSSTHEHAIAILNTLLLTGNADACAVDTRGRPPYYLASSDKIREAFRLARGKLGEDYCAWDTLAKVPSALSPEDIEAKRIKALEKKKRQRERQKEKKREEAEAAAETKRIEEEKAAIVKAEDDAKRARDGLKPKTAGNACDFCGKIVKKKSSMLQRLQYYYCSTDCVKRHQRELAAAAAQARLEK
jgi:hypothetical protein